MLSQRFTGKVVLVTGGVAGIGAAITAAFLAEGAHVVAVDINASAVETFAAENSGAALTTRVLDVTDPAAVTATIDDIARILGRLDVVIPNAGIALPGSVADLDDRSWEAVLRVDLFGVFHVARAATPHLEQVGGCIVSTASISGLGGDIGLAAYNAAKGGVVSLTRSMAIDLGRRGIRVNAVAPGPVATDALKMLFEAKPAIRDTYAERIPLGRPAEPAEIAATMLFLASQDASYITGVTLPVDGGLTSWTGQPDLMA